MIFKTIACWKLAKKYNLPSGDVFLPTGCDCILEGVLAAEGVYDEDGYEIEIVNKNINYWLWSAVPLFGAGMFIVRLVWRYVILLRYVAPAIYPKLGEWRRLCLVIIPSVFYVKIWRDMDVSDIRETEEVSNKICG